MLSSIYLTGGTLEPSELVNQGAALDWRSVAMNKMRKYGLKVVNPLEFAFPELAQLEGMEGIELINDTTDLKVKRALDLIDQCDALLANLHRPSYAAAMEIFYAHRTGKMVTVVGHSPFSPWVLSHSQARFGDIDLAINYLLEEQPQASPLLWAMNYETILAERYEQFPAAGEPDYQFVGGDLPVLALAPHATAYWREGEFQEPDTFTGSIATSLHRSAGCHSLTTNYCCVADPCFYLETPYRRALADVVKTGQVGLVVMLVGAAWHQAPGIQLHAAGPNPSVNADYINRLKNKLSVLEPVATESYDPLQQPIIDFISEELAVPVIAVKLHKRYRMPRLQAEGFSRVAEILDEFITEAGNELLRSRS